VKRANPFSGVTTASLEKNFGSPTMTLGHWCRFKCNMPTRSDLAAITEAEWAAAITSERIPAGESIWLGLDLGFKRDTTAMVPLWIRDPEFRLFGAATILEPPRNGDQLDAHLVEQALVEIHERNPIETVVMDMTQGAQLSQWIMEEFDADVVDRTQSPKLLALDYARFMEALREGWLKHTGDPGLTSHALNAVARVLQNGDAVFERPDKSRSVGHELARRRVVDALDAAAMVHTSAAAYLADGDEIGAFLFDPVAA
jgi:phage terminase large subunit-like protein